MQTWGRYTVFSCIERTYLAEVHDAYLPIAADLVRRVHIRKPSSVRGGASALVQHARQAVQLAHGRIAPILELSYAGDVPLVVSEGVSGRSLATLIEQSRAQQLNLDTNAILYIVIATLEALAHMHQHTDPSGRLLGLVHRDLRPQAVWIGFDGAVHLGGFGFSVTGTAPREPMPPLVEPMYWAPELAAGRAVDHRSDIFSVGAILFELLAKQSVWPGETHEEQLFAASRGQMNVLGPMASSMPAELVRAVEASLSPNPDDRPPSATIFRDELARILYRAEPAYGSARLASTVAMVLGEEAAEDQARATAALHHLAHLEPGLVIRTPDDTSSASPPVSTEPLVESSPSTRERSPAEDSPPVVDVAHLAADLSPTPAASASDLANDFSWLETDHLVSLRHEGS
ncbi:MAG: protein kinase, partial [Myxococcota bacterium]